MAKTFTSLSDMQSFFEQKIKAGNKSVLGSVKNADGLSLGEASKADLEKAADAMQEFIQNRIQEYYDSHTPSTPENRPIKPPIEWGGRTGGLKNSVMVKMPSPQEAVVYFDEGLAYGESLFGGSPGFKPALIDKGWNAFPGPYRFGHFDGTGFFEKAIADAKGDERFEGIKITPVYE